MKQDICSHADFKNAWLNLIKEASKTDAETNVEVIEGLCGLIISLLIKRNAHPSMKMHSHQHSSQPRAFHGTCKHFFVHSHRPRIAL